MTPNIRYPLWMFNFMVLAHGYHGQLLFVHTLLDMIYGVILMVLTLNQLFVPIGNSTGTDSTSGALRDSEWHRIDHYIYPYLMGSVDHSLTSHIVVCQTTRDMRLYLTEHFVQSSGACEYQLSCVI